MPRTPTWRPWLFALAAAGSLIMSLGCATWQGPRIDPTGESLLIWPGESTTLPPPAPIVAPAAGPPVVSPSAIAPAATPPAIALAQPLPPMVPSTPFGNVVAPPVYSDPPGTVPTAPLVGPGPGVPAPPITLPPPPATGPPVAAAPVLGQIAPLPPPPAIAATPILPSAPSAAPGRPFLCVSPSGLVAPVGSEMVLKAGVITPDRQTAAGQRIDWFIAPTGAGQFSNLGIREWSQFWGYFEAPQTIDERTATTTTATVPITLNSSTPDPTDDVPIFRGEAWVTVASAVEGTSVVTAIAPGYAEFNQATSTIYWVDAQWVFPQSAVVEPGRAHTLTTTLMRRTDGAPLAGWTVRYDVSGTAGVGYEGGSSVETATDAAGRASVEVSPKDVGGGAANVQITIIRPTTVGPVAMPRLELGRGAATISWAQPAPSPPGVPTAPSLPAAPVPLPTPLASPPPTLPSAPAPMPAPTGSPNPYTAPTTPAGTPRLDVAMRRTNTEQVAVGEFASFELTITNRGDGVARNILVSDQFDRGLRHEKAQPNEYAIKYPGIRDLQPNESQTIRLTFQVVDGGTQCHEATVTADGAEPVKQQGCVTARPASLEVSVNGPRSRVVGEIAEFSALVKNGGDVAATNIEVVLRCDPAIEPIMAASGSQQLADSGILLRIERLEPGERRTLGLQGRCRADAKRACVRAIVTADGGVSQAAENCVEILPPLSSVGPVPGAVQPPAASGLQLTVATVKNPARVGEKQLLNITLANTGQQAERQISLRILLPPEFTPDPQQIQPASEATILPNEIRFATIAEVAAGQHRTYVVPVTPNRTGRVQFRAELAAPSLSATKTADSEVIEIVAAAP